MNSPFLHVLRRHLMRDFILLLIFSGLMLQSVQAAAPGWWTDRGVLKPQASQDDYAAINIGQLKNFVRAAITEMNAKLPNGTTSAAQSALDNLLSGWSTNSAGADSYRAATVGQVKQVAKLCYNRLKEVGYATEYPWSHGAKAAEDYAVANAGQLKNLLSFDFDRDADRNGIPDWKTSADAAKQFNASTWLPVSTTGTIFADSEHHSRSSELGYGVRGGPTALPPNAAGIKNDPVATIPGEFKVGQDGSAGYTVHIETPKGIANVEPGITLEYNSNTGNGIAGVGWSIGGVTVINRGPATVEVDGFYDPPDFDSNDRFYLDGERLLCVAGTYGADGSEYRTQREQFSRVIYHKTATENWFEVWTKAGLRMEFGHCNTSCINSTSPGDASYTLTWAVNKVSDNLGNYWQVVYTDVSNPGTPTPGLRVLPNYTPDSIVYTGTASNAPMHKIQFYYEDRPDVSVGYVLGAQVVKGKRLKHIEVCTGSTSLRTYTLDYEISPVTGNSRLHQLNLKAGPPPVAGQTIDPSLTCLPSTFTWSAGDTGWKNDMYLTSTQRATEQARLKLRGDHPVNGGTPAVSAYVDSGIKEPFICRFDDLNGDGLNDALVRHLGGRYYYRSIGTNFGFAATDQTTLLLNRGGGLWDDRTSSMPNLSGFPMLTSSSSAGAMLMDVNSDGLSDAITTDTNVYRDQFVYLQTNSSQGITHRVVNEILDLSVTNPVGKWFGSSTTTTCWQAATTADQTRYAFPTVPSEVYQSGHTFPYQGPVSFTTAVEMGWRTVDMDGDGNVDLIRAGQGPNASVVMGAGRELCFGLRNNGPQSTGSAWSLMNDTSNPNTTMIWKLPLPLTNQTGDQDMGRRLIDVNGDRLPDFVYQRARAVPPGAPAWGDYDKYEVAVYLNRGADGWVDGGTSWVLPGEGFSFGTLEGYGRGLVDLNGDSLPDFVTSWTYLDASNNVQFQNRVYLNTGSGWTADQPLWHLPRALQVAELWFFMNKNMTRTYPRYLQDVNGDGMPEFIDAWRDDKAIIGAPGLTAPEVYTMSKNGGGWVLASGWNIPSSFLPHAGQSPSRAYSPAMASSLSYNPILGYLEYWADSPLQMSDLNGDGLVDLLNCTSAGTEVYWNKAASEKVTTITNGLGVPITVNYETLPRLGAEPDTAANPRRYVRGTKPDYAQSDVVPAAWVVTDYTTPDGVGGNVTSYYRYGGFRTGQYRSLGFEWMEVRDSSTPVVQYTQYYQDPPEYAGLPKLAQSYYMKAGTGGGAAIQVILSQASNTYATISTATALEGNLTPKPAAKFIYADTSSTSKKDPDNNPLGTTNTIYGYDNWGNLTDQTATSGDGAQVVNHNDYADPVTNATSWVLGQVSTSTVTHRAPTAQRAASPDVIKTSSFTYDPTTHLLKTETIHSGTAKAVTKTHYRDGFGNITSTVTTAAGEAESITTQTIYDDSGRFPLATTNALGQTVASTYDTTNDTNRSVVLTTSMPFQGVASTAPAGTPSSSFVYDDWGTTRVTTGPDGLQAVRYTKLFSSSALPQAVYYVYEQAEGSTPVVSYYDRHHRVLMTETSGFDGTPVLQRVTYDAKGRVVQKTNPYFYSAAVIPVTQYYYDDFGRQWKVTSPDGTNTIATFSGLSSTSTIDGNATQAAQSKTGVHDEHGRLVSVTDSGGGTISYTYTADDLLQTATTTHQDGSPGTTVTTAYDPVTRAKYSVTDPNAGTSYSFFDGFGRLVRTQDAMGVEHHFTYDLLGRMLTRDTVETSTTWTYDAVTNSSNGLGQVDTVTHTTKGVTPAPATSEKVTYDTLGRVVQTSILLANQPAFNGLYTTSVSYDDLGRADIAVDAGGFATQNEYNAFGFKSGLRRAYDPASRILWRAFSCDAEGRILQERHGNGIATDSVYNVLRGSLTSATSYRPGLGGAASRSLQTLELSVNNLGNVEWRKSTTYDSTGNATLKTENFTFDGLNRLQTSQVGSLAIQTFVYAGNGNITSKTGVGSYTYHATKKHAVQSVTASDGIIHVYGYDDNGRMTTETVQQTGQADRLVRQINYTSFHQPSSITHYASPKLSTDRPISEMGGVPSTCQIQFYYGSGLQRLIQVKMKGAIKTTVLYLGAYEVREVYEDAGATLIEREERSSFGNGTQLRRFSAGTSLTIPIAETEFKLADHLGSTSAIHDENGDVKRSRGQLQVDERHSYDAWGARRDSNTWAPAGPMLGHTPPPPPPTAETPDNTAPKLSSSQPRGFTGHEMLDDVGLVHMNGRLYDSALGRFCSADPIIQEGENDQNYNRYSYVLNNPMSNTDPSGFSFWKSFFRALVAIVVVVVVVVLILVASVGAAEFLTVLSDGVASGGLVGGAGAFGATYPVAAGAILGGAFAAINAAVQGGSFSEVLKAAVTGAVTGAITAGVSSTILHAMGEEAFGSLEGQLIHSIAHGVVGGAMTEAQGGSFKDGFIGSLIGSGVSAGMGMFVGGAANALGVVGRTALAAMSGGIASKLSGGKFSDGAWSAGFLHLFNDEASRWDYIKKLSRSQVDNQALSLVRKIDHYFDGNPTSAYVISTEELFFIMTRDSFRIWTQGWENMSKLEYADNSMGRNGIADGIFFRWALESFTLKDTIIKGELEAGTTFKGSDINYSYLGAIQGMRYPSAQRFNKDVNASLIDRIVAWNTVQAMGRRDTADLKQITKAVAWAQLGFINNANARIIWK